ncbi:MAG TPA: hypothetical protein ENO08_07085, partial [Candidatus Eisenbacteria bacterium]|nr:hypothetical protein [Candidatus Eisenbacteria bacterium]
MSSNHTESAHWHAMALDEVLGRLDGSSDGLSGDEARRRLEETGPNSLATGEGPGPWRMLAGQFLNPLIYLLAAAAVLSLLVGHGVDAAVIAGVIILNAILGFIQEWRAEGAMEALRGMAAPHARVLRSGERVDIDASAVVPGDVLAIETGDRLAADARLLSGDNLRVDESALTGESQPVAKGPGRLEDDTPMADRTNMVWMSTNVTGGRGTAVVVETGMRTQMG